MVSKQEGFDMGKYKKYKTEIILFVILVSVLICLVLMGWLDKESIINDGTFVIGFLSIPIATSRYMSEKEESNRINEKQNELEADKFYYETLNILNDLSDSSSMQIKIMQLSKIRNQGYKYLSEDIVEDFNKILGNTAINIITQDINFSESEDHRIIFDFEDKINNRNDKISERGLLDANREVLERISNRIKSNKVYLNKIFRVNENIETNSYRINEEVCKILLDKYNNRLFFKARISEDAYNEIEFDRGSDYIFYECVFEDFSDFEKLSNYTLIKPLFNFTDEDKRDSFVSSWLSGVVVYDKIYQPKAKLKGNWILLGTEVTKEDVLIEADYYLVKEDLTRKEIKNKFKDKYSVKISRNYNKDKDGSYNSWYTISEKLKEDIEKDNKDSIFVVDGGDLNLYIKIDAENMAKLFDQKKADQDEDLHRYHFYLNAYKMEDGSYELEDSRFKDSPIKFKAKKIPTLGSLKVEL